MRSPEPEVLRLVVEGLAARWRTDGALPPDVLIGGDHHDAGDVLRAASAIDCLFVSATTAGAVGAPEPLSVATCARLLMDRAEVSR